MTTAGEGGEVGHFVVGATQKYHFFTPPLSILGKSVYGSSTTFFHPISVVRGGINYSNGRHAKASFLQLNHWTIGLEGNYSGVSKFRYVLIEIKAFLAAVQPLSIL